MFYERITTALAGLVTRSWDSFGMLVLDIEREQLLPVVRRLKGEFGFDLFLDVTAIDHLTREPRFDVVYHFLCSAQHRRIRLKTPVAEQDPSVATLTHLYGSARFMEREAHEMYGIQFTGNHDLRPILLYEGFVGHPLRKDYPMELEQPIVPYRK
ncbi:MAG: NADH-quinone oxidoreductase subunit C [Rubrivivax sp.]|nr:NADH-quinone oxidoreductase subunit C [Rubrivivax sp.]